jgi:hypothetical protein
LPEAPLPELRRDELPGDELRLRGDELRAEELPPPALRPPELRPLELRPLELRPLELRPLELRPLELRPLEDFRAVLCLVDSLLDSLPDDFALWLRVLLRVCRSPLLDDFRDAPRLLEPRPRVADISTSCGSSPTSSERHELREQI